MTHRITTFLNGPIFDGKTVQYGMALRCEDGRISAFGPQDDVDTSAATVVNLNGDILSPGYVDLQVNGGDGIMFNADPSVDTLRRISAAHRRLGVTALLPTLITDTPETTRAAIAAGIEAIAAGVPGITGLHLEGPHLSVARKGAHDAALIRPMEAADLDALLRASRSLPVLKVTVAPENVTEDQVATLARAGVLVSLGHTDADFDTCCRYFAAGARCATHLFNAMSQLGNREPGLVGAALATGAASAGLIADAVHVHPDTMRVAWAAKSGPGRIFLVSDAMAVAGTQDASFELGGREITRRNGILTLADGTLAGADLDLTTAVRVMTDHVGVSLDAALAAATTVPAALIDLPATRFERIGAPMPETIRIAANLSGVRADQTG